MSKINVLDHGFVELVDSLGTDLTVVNSARVSFGKRKTEIEEADEKLIKYLAKHEHWSPFRHVQLQFHIKMPEFVARQTYKHCYSDDTSVLTPSGWKLLSDLSPGEPVAQEEGGKFFFVVPTDYVSRPYEGPMHLYETQSMSLCVTDKHRIIAHKRRDKVWGQEEVFLSEEIMNGGEYKLPLVPVYRFPVEGTEIDYWLGALYGFFLADGSCTATKDRITFSFKKKHKQEFIERILSNVGSFTCHNVYRDGYKIYHIDNPDRKLFTGKCVDSTKAINFEYTLQSKSFAQGVLDGLLKGDGHVTLSGTIRYSSSQENLIEDVSLLALYLGNESSTERYKENYYITNIKKPANRYFTNKECIDYSGHVYCVTVPSGKLLVKRNGKVSVCGNCIGAEYTVGGGANKDHAWNEISMRYVNVEDFDVYLPRSFRKQSESNKQASTDEKVYPMIGLNEGNYFRWKSKGASLDHAEQYDVYKGREELQAHIDTSFRIYEELIDQGVAKEQARAYLPLCIYTEFYWTASLQAVVNFIRLRKHEGAQWEIRQYADALETLVEKVVPVSYKALLG